MFSISSKRSHYMHLYTCLTLRLLSNRLNSIHRTQFVIYKLSIHGVIACYLWCLVYSIFPLTPVICVIFLDLFLNFLLKSGADSGIYVRGAQTLELFPLDRQSFPLDEHTFFLLSLSLFLSLLFIIE